VLTHGLGELEQISRGPEDTIRLSPPLAQELIVVWNHERQSSDQITRLYWQVSRSTIAAVVINVRTALAGLVGELLAAAPDDDQPPSKQAVDAPQSSSWSPKTATPSSWSTVKPRPRATPLSRSQEVLTSRRLPRKGGGRDGANSASSSGCRRWLLLLLPSCNWWIGCSGNDLVRARWVGQPS
jgi:hypothetical protein